MKSDFELSKTLTINCGNFNSIKPNVSLKISDIPIDKIDIIYKEASEALNILLQLEEAELFNEIMEIRKETLTKHIENIINQDFTKLQNSLKQNLKVINDIGKHQLIIENSPKDDELPF